MSSNHMQYGVNEYILVTEPFTDFHFTNSFSVLQRERSPSFLFCLLFSCSQEIPNLSLAGLCFLKKGEKNTLVYTNSQNLYVEIPVNDLSLLIISSCCPTGMSQMPSLV